jgi:hypothetical protein
MADKYLVVSYVRKQENLSISELYAKIERIMRDRGAEISLKLLQRWDEGIVPLPGKRRVLEEVLQEEFASSFESAQSTQRSNLRQLFGRYRQRAFLMISVVGFLSFLFLLFFLEDLDRLNGLLALISTLAAIAAFAPKRNV